MRVCFLRLPPSLCWRFLVAICPEGQPPAEIVKRPTDILDPIVLYKHNCAGCHGEEGKSGPTPPIGDSLYLAVVDDNTLRNTISKGRPGTVMPGFVESEGGMLTSKQVDTCLFAPRGIQAKKGERRKGAQPEKSDYIDSKAVLQMEKCQFAIWNYFPFDATSCCWCFCQYRCRACLVGYYWGNR